MSETATSSNTMADPDSPIYMVTDSQSNEAPPESVSTNSHEAQLFSELASINQNPMHLQYATNYLYESLLDDLVLGIVFELHYALKRGILQAIEGKPEDPNLFRILEIPDYDIFGMSTTAVKKNCDCQCPNCERLVSASRFAPHLEKCMGMGRNSSRIASRRIANAREGISLGISDDDDDADCDWSGEKKQKRVSHNKNGVKKTGKTFA